MAKKRLTARGRDIERLSKQYQMGLADISKQFAEVSTYPEEMKLAQEEFQTKSAEYQKGLQKYRDLLTDIQKRPTEVVNAPVRQAGRSGRVYTINGQEYGEFGLPQGYFIESTKTGKKINVVVDRSGRTETRDEVKDMLYRARAIPSYGTFATQNKLMKQAPVAPDTTEFDTKRQQERENLLSQRKGLSEQYEREIGERKSGRIAATTRRAQMRPMLFKR